MTMSERDDFPDDRLAALLSASEREGPPPDRERLARLREQSTAVFTSQSEPAASTAERNSPMMILTMRLLATAALIGAVMTTLNLWQQGDNETDRGLVRAFEHAGDEGKLDVLTLAGIGELQAWRSALADAAHQRVNRDGRDWDLFVVRPAAPSVPSCLEILVDPRTGRLAELTALAERDGRRERLTRVRFVAFDQPVDEALFVVGDTLTEDGRIGKITDWQGLVSVQPVGQRRWTPVTAQVLLRPGDWLRTDVRGANAAAVQLVKQTRVTVGPGALVELPTPKQIRLHYGELKIVADKRAAVELLGPRDQTVKIAGTAIYRIDRRNEQLVEIPAKKLPLWLQGFEGTTARDAVGSLVANIDGRNEPLTVGYHKVTVDIRDQIARTVIEESFVNHTNGRLEGVFYFPLLQDASISGFGMWIGNELVEADVVEKQRAREIYETILRERRDPGLLEWTGGNLFKARVFPIEPRSEKRIKITYTQVLPLQHNQFRYSYALQSELLQQHPLRELSLQVTINSVLPLAEVRSPTHSARIERTPHAARVEFAAQEYTPDRDFEVVVQLEPGQQNVVLIPHRRGDDGYFMCLLTPPVSNGVWQRETLPDGQPQQLLVLADTSGSMDAASRENQRQFLAALFGALTPEDRLNLAVIDVDCQWSFPTLVPATPENVAQALQRLDERISLGWTDLDKAFAAARERCAPDTQIVYVGDGIVTTGDADPVAFSQRLQRLFAGADCGLHAVSVSSRYEPIVVRAIASLGGGSMRPISGERTPTQVAVELLGELTQPSLRDLQVEFRGLRVARVYPERLPNLPAGTQQIMLGRYLPEGDDQRGEIVVTGQYAGKPVRFSSPVSLRDAEQGNSFIPRLWARMHLDRLLEQGATAAIKDEIIALSEEYHIITPYTSLLVLETDEDRERFQVKRGFQMRDGEKFFAAGRDQADFELMQQQMRLAGTWRLGLRRQVLSELSGLGRERRLLDSAAIPYPTGGPAPMIASQPMSGASWAYGMPMDRTSGMGGFGGGSFGLDNLSSSGAFPTDGSELNFGEPFDGGYLGDRLADDSEDLFAESSDAMAGEKAQRAKDELSKELDSDSLLVLNEVDMSGPMERFEEFGARASYDLKSRLDRFAFNMPASKPMRGPVSSRTRGLDLRWGGYLGGGSGARDWYGYQSPDPTWLLRIFPELPPTPTASQFPPSDWPDEARKLAASLLRNDRWAALDGGLLMERQGESFDARWDRLSGRQQTLSLVSPDRWLVRNEGDGSQTSVQWCDPQQRGVSAVEFGLGRVRASVPLDRADPPLGLPGFVQQSIEQSYRIYRAEVEPAGDDRAQLMLTEPAQGRHQVVLLIDTARQVVLSIEQRQDGRATSVTRMTDFVEAAGAWWATRVETFDDQSRRTSATTLKYTQLDRERFQQRVDRQLAGLGRVQLLKEPLPIVPDAKQAVADQRDTFEHQFVLALHAAAIQNWDRVARHFDRATEIGGAKPGMRWVRYDLLLNSRQREPLRLELLAEAKKLAGDDKGSWYLAEHLVGRASGIFEANEMLALLDVLQPVYERQAAHTQAAKSVESRRANYLRSTGQSDRALALERRLAEQYPHDANLQQQYARSLASAGEYDAAYAWLDAAANPEARWLPHEQQTLQNTYTELLWQQGRYTDLATRLEAWTSENPADQYAYSQFLSALVRTDDEDRATELMDRWIAEARKPAPLDLAVAARLEAAVNLALGQGHNLHSQRLELRWLPVLAETAEFFAVHGSHAQVADRIMTDWRFTSTDACRDVRRRIVGLLTEQIETLPAARLSSLIGWIMSNDPAVETPQWQRIAAGIEQRWAAETDVAVRNQLASSLIQILSSRLTADEHLRFLRRQLKEGPQDHRPGYAKQLFQALLTQPWTAELENEAFDLLPQQAASSDASRRLLEQVAALYELADRMVAGRYQASIGAIEHPEELTRTELRERQQQAQQRARREFAARLLQEQRAAEAELTRWFHIERLALVVQLGEELAAVRDDCWERLGSKPTPIADEDPARAMLEHVFRHRLLMTVANLAARRGAQRDDFQKLLDYLDRAIAQTDGGDDATFAWKMFKYRLLVALDRAQELEAALRDWIKPEDADNYWRRALGFLQAEQGRFAESIALFEKIEADDELSPSDYRALANWHQVVGQQDKHERALMQIFLATEEWQLRNWLSQRLRPWQRQAGELPGELDRDVLRVFAALFRKSSQPKDHLWQLREFYRATRDFRLLADLPDAVVGHTAGRVYPFLQNMTTVLNEIRDEATADSLVERIDAARATGQTPIDARALDLLELLVERRSSEVLNQPGPHVDRALAAIRRAFDRQWTSGEPRLVADLLADLGTISQTALADEQVRQLETLHRQADAGSIDRLHIAHALARSYWAYSRHDAAIDLLESALNEHQTASDGVLPADANGALDRLIGYLELRKHFARGEKLLFGQLQRPANQQQVFWLRQRLYQLYQAAIDGDGAVSLGQGADLYRAATQQLRDELETTDDNHRYQLVNRLCSIYRAAKGRSFDNVLADLRDFAFGQLPEVLKLQTNNYQSIVSQVAQTLEQVGGPRDALELLIERIENEPRWLRLSNQDGWSQHGHQLGNWRHRTGDALGDLAPRLLKIVVEELRRDLMTGQSRNRDTYHRQHGGYFWAEKFDDFARVAEEVYAQRKDSASGVAFIADYMFRGVERHDRAIQMLSDAHRREILDESGQSKLVDFLHQRQRYADSIPVLEPLIATRPDNMQYRTWLMHAYWRTGRRDDLLALLKQTDEHFHRDGRWQEPAMAALAASCLENERFEQSVAYYVEVIALHQRTQPGRGIGQGTLSGYYSSLARAHAGLKDTAGAVDAACGAIVSWGPRHEQRDYALQSLDQVLRDAPDLDAYVQQLDRQAAETGLHNALVRKALGKVYADKGQHAAAIAQLRLAVELEPNDTETHQRLIACYDATSDRDGAIQQLLQSLEWSRRSSELFKDLGQRYEQMERADEAERAFTSIVEALPNESEGHAALAEIRQRQDRWSDAAGHWREVARIRALEPTGLLNLAAAQIQLKQHEAAAETIRQLQQQSWPQRFTDIDQQIRDLQRRLE
jgi:predicted Zn-dependent protease